MTTPSRHRDAWKLLSSALIGAGIIALGLSFYQGIVTAELETEWEQQISSCAAMENPGPCLHRVDEDYGGRHAQQIVREGILQFAGLAVLSLGVGIAIGLRIIPKGQLSC